MLNDTGIMHSNSDLIIMTYLYHFDDMFFRIDNYSDAIKKYFKSFLANTLIWYGSTLNKRKRRAYIKIIKQKGVVDLLDRRMFRKKVIKFLFFLNLYYPIKKIKKCEK